MPEYIPSTCDNPECAGTGFINGEVCPTCFGTGSLPVAGFSPRTLKALSNLSDKVDDVMDKVNDIKEKVDEIKTVVDAL